MLFRSLLSKLKVKNTIFSPLITDELFFKPQTLIDETFKDKLVIFHPASHIWHVKGNDRLIKGFATFVKSNPNSILLAVDWGKDSNRSKELIKSLGIEKNIKFLSLLSAKDLLYYYSISDIVVDQFVTDGIGAIGMETLFCGKPLVTKCGKHAYDGLYSESIPLLDATTAEQIDDALEYLKNKDSRDEIGRNAKAWAEKFLSPNAITSNFIKIYESIFRSLSN